MTAPILQFLVPATPQAKGRARSTVRRGKGGRPILTKTGQPIVATYTPEKTRDFEALVRFFAGQAMGDREPLAIPVDLVCEFRFNPPKSWPKWRTGLALRGLVHHTKVPDCSNLVKAIEDACNGVLFKDDGQVVGAIQDKAWTAGSEGISVTLYPRAGVTCSATQAEAVAFLATYDADTTDHHLPIGHRFNPAKRQQP